MAFSSSVEFLGGGFSRAHMQRRGEGGRKENIRGPRRGDKRKAEEDLEELRAAAAEACPTSAWNAMVAKARRLQHQAVFETRVAIRVAQSEEGQSSSLSSLNSIDREAFDADDDSQLDVDTQEYYGDDNELWQEIDEEGNLPASYQPPPRTPFPDPKDTIEATVLLSKFRPTRMSTEDLKKLLDARADPNITLPGSIHPLFKVMTFASADQVGPMRDLLLQAGAVESDEAKERWALRRSTDATEKAWLRNFHADPSLVPYMCG